MGEANGDRGSVNRTIYQLDSLYKRLSPQEFGRVMQQVLACGFEAAGFHVVENAVGVPDFTATSPMTDGHCETIAVEVKTSDKTKISLTQRELDGNSYSRADGCVGRTDLSGDEPWLAVDSGGQCLSPVVGNTSPGHEAACGRRLRR